MSFQWIKPEQNAALPPEPRVPSIPQTQTPAVPAGFEGFWEQAGEILTGPEPAATVAERFGMTPGADIRSEPQRATTKVTTPDDAAAERNRRQMSLAVQLATQAGALDNPDGNNVKAAREHAAMVTEAVRRGTWTTSEDKTPGRWANPKGVAGHTEGYGGGRR